MGANRQKGQTNKSFVKKSDVQATYTEKKGRLERVDCVVKNGLPLISDRQSSNTPRHKISGYRLTQEGGRVESEI